MKILYVITKSEEGGAQTHVYQLSRYFINQGYEVAVMSNPGGWLEAEIKKLGGKFYANLNFSNSYNPLNLLKSIVGIKSVVMDFQPNVVHCHSSMAGLLGRLAVRGSVPTLYTAHGWGFNNGVPFLQKQLAILGERFAAQYCDRIICVSKFVKDLALKYKIAKAEKFEVIYNGVETNYLLSKKTDNKIRIIFVGRLADPKRPLLLLQTITNLPNELKTNLEVLVIGNGPLKTELENYINNNNLYLVKMLGNLSREAVLLKLCHSDIFVLLSQWEGLPLSALEAMSVGLPVVVSNVGGLSEVINSNNGFLINNAGQLSEVLSNLIQMEDLRKKIGDAARQSIIESYSIEKMLMRIEGLYKSL